MTEEENIKRLIEKQILSNNAIDKKIYDLLTAENYLEPIERAKPLLYLATLELVKLKARSIDQDSSQIVYSAVASAIHSMLEMIYRDDITIILATLDGVTRGILDELQINAKINKQLPTLKEDSEHFLDRWK